MKISYAQALATPLTVVLRQLKYKAIENQIKQQKMEQENAKSK